MGRRTCLDCGTLVSSGSRCRECKQTKDYRSPDDRAARRLVIKLHVARFGYVCPGYEVIAHPSKDLTADHIVPLAKGGSRDVSNLQVLCRECNGRKADREG